MEIDRAFGLVTKILFIYLCDQLVTTMKAVSVVVVTEFPIIFPLPGFM